MNLRSRQVCGIDISSKKFDVCFKQQDGNGKISIRGSRSFANDHKGFGEYLAWTAKRKKDNDLLHVVEATGTYHENLCYFLHGNSEKVSVQLAQRAKYFIKSLNIKTKTDKVDAAALARMGLVQQLGTWRPISGNFKDIRDLSRTLVRLKDQIVTTKAQLHAMETAHLARECEQRIFDMVDQDRELSQKIGKITAIKGVNVITVVKLLAETDGFRKVRSIKSLVSYAGLDVVQNQSGMHKGKSTISKKGNAHIRTALYMPAMSAAKHDKKSREFYGRLNQRLPKKKQSLVAVMRKLLVIIYTLWKNNEEYDPKHDRTKKRQGLSPVTG